MIGLFLCKLKKKLRKCAKNQTSQKLQKRNVEIYVALTKDIKVSVEYLGRIGNQNNEENYPVNK